MIEPEWNPATKRVIPMKTVLIVLRLFLILGISVSALAQEGQRNQGNAPPELGNNLEAEGFARSAMELAKSTWSKGEVVWRLELTPKEIKTKDIVSYRKSVKYCKVTISINRDEWFRLSETQQKNYISTTMHTLHKPPVFAGQVLDYYPNSSGEVSIVVDRNIVSTGKYTPAESEVFLKPNTFKPDEVAKYSANISVLLESNSIRLQGTTNIPNSEFILFTLSKGQYKAQSKVTVQNGSFSTEVFRDKGQPLPFGKYLVSLNTINPMLEAKGSIILPETRSLSVTFAPTKLNLK